MVIHSRYSKTEEDSLNKMIALQSKFNDKTNGVVWRNNVTETGKPIDWMLATHQEITETIDSINWKWWKSLDSGIDMANIKIELTDIVHFLISETIRTNKQYILDKLLHVDFITLNNDSCVTSDLNKDLGTILVDRLLTMDEYVLVYRRLSRGKNPLEATLALENVISAFNVVIHTVQGFSFMEMYKMYIGKNALNQLRQDNGYKDGTYDKLWNGIEDNVYLTELLNKHEDVTGDYFNHIYSNLEVIYKDR